MLVLLGGGSGSECLTKLVDVDADGSEKGTEAGDQLLLGEP